MGEIKSKWCFHGTEGKTSTRSFCVEGKVDTGASVAVLPYAEAKRLGVAARKLLGDDGMMVSRRHLRMHRASMFQETGFSWAECLLRNISVERSPSLCLDSEAEKHR